MNIRINDIPKCNFLSDEKAAINIRKNTREDDTHENDFSVPQLAKQYILLVGVEGSVRLMHDFQEMEILAPFVFVLQPGQIYQLIITGRLKIYCIDFLPDIISSSLRNLLYRYLINKPVVHCHETLRMTTVISELMYQLSDEPGNVYHHQSLHALLLSLLNLLVACDLPAVQQAKKETRSMLIEQEFQILLKDQYKKWKKPCQYAMAMAISVSHLNDTVSELTGRSVSDHIQQFGMLEAKRLLCCTSWNVKEIGFELGFEDPIYFNKLFKKVAGITPMQFKSQFRNQYVNIKPGEDS